MNELDKRTKMQITVAIIRECKGSLELDWQLMQKGYSNIKYKITRKDGTPLAVCKIYNEDNIISPITRLKNEKKAIEIFAGTYAPTFIWSNNKKILVYKYISATETTETWMTEEKQKQIVKMIKNIHQKGKQLHPKIGEIKTFYKNLIHKYKKVLYHEYPSLIDSLQKQSTDLLDTISDYSHELTYIHGDLIPTNFLLQDNRPFLVDWEYFRPELTIFDIEYLNYYADKEQVDIHMSHEYPQLTEIYKKLIDSLNKCWWLNYKKNTT